MNIYPGDLEKMEASLPGREQEVPALEPLPQGGAAPDFRLSAAELDELAMQSQGQGAPRQYPVPVERLSAEQLAGTPEQQEARRQFLADEQANIDRLREQVAYKPIKKPSDADDLMGTGDPAAEDLTAKPPTPKDPGLTREGLTRDFEAAQAQHRREYETALKGLDGDMVRARANVDKAKGALATATTKLGNWEINPNRAFSNAFSKVAAVISVAMGAYAQGLSGGKLPNTALGIINNAIKTDIDAQKMEFEKLKGMVDERRNVYAMGIRLLGSEQQAKQLAMTVAYRALGQKTKETANLMGFQLDLAKLDETERYHEGLLENAAIKNATTGGAVKDKEFKQSVVLFETTRSNFQRMWKSSQNINMFEAAAKKVGDFLGAETQTGRFNKESKKVMLQMLRAMSGKVVTEKEVARYEHLFPKATTTQARREADMVSMLGMAADEGAARYLAMSPQERILIAQQAPDLVAVWSERDPFKRQVLIREMAGTGEDEDAGSGLDDLGGTGVQGIEEKK